MFDIGWSEMAVIALVALVVLGPKELPQAMKTFAAFTRKMQRYARDFRTGVDNIVREAELEDAKKALDAVRVNPKKMIKNIVDPSGEAVAAVAAVEVAARADGSAEAAPAAAGEAVAAAPPALEKPSNVIMQPTNMAPPHSIRPPAPKEALPVASSAAAASPAPAKPAGGEPPAGSSA
jgi:sec-independent protein translocase protein TatB